MSKPLTPKQQKVLNTVQNYINEYNFPPTLNELSILLSKSIKKEVGLSTAQYYIEELVKKGYISKDSNQARGIMLKKNNFPKISKLGFISAGNPIEPIEDPELIELPREININPHNQYYALEVKGDSMIDMGILSGDTVVIKHQMSAKNGDVVVAITEKGATLKILRKEKGTILLMPRNEKYKPIIPKELEIRGVLAGLIRSNSN